MSTPPPPPEDNVVIPLPPDVVVVAARRNDNNGESIGPNFKDQAREVSFVAAAAAVVGSQELPLAAAGDGAQQEGEQQQQLGESLSSLTATAASSPALTSTVIPLAQATPITVSQIHEEERVQLEQRNAELQAALEERQQVVPAATDSVGGVFAAVISLAAAYWSKLSLKQRRRRWFCFITCMVLIITTAVLVDQSNKQRWKRRWQRRGERGSQTSGTEPPSSFIDERDTILDIVVDSENHTIWRALIEAAAPGDKRLFDVFNDTSAYYPYVFAPTDATVEHHQVPVQQLLTSEWRLHRHCFVLGHFGTSVLATAAASEINTNFVEEVNGTTTMEDEWSTLWPGFTMMIRLVHISDPYYNGPFPIDPSWVNGIPFFAADMVYTADGWSWIYVLHERPITPPCVSQSLWEVITSIADLSVFVAWVEAAGLTELFNATNVPTTDVSYTVFAPTNTAFAYLPPSSSSSTNNRSSSLDILLRNSSDVTVIKTLLLGHVVAGNWYTANDDDEYWWQVQDRGNGTAASSRRSIGAGGHNLTVIDDNTIGMIFDGGDDDTEGVVLPPPPPPAVIATITTANVLAGNGVLHLIDAVLWPPQ
jgi:uncharacterized surface protein with fasciclin (FAS1) repeats